MADRLGDLRIAALFTEGVEQIELIEPARRLRDEGARVDFVAPHEGSIQGMDHADKGQTFEADRKVSDVHPDEYDGLLLPGGVRNPDKLRMDAEAVALVRAMSEAGLTIAAICHGPWLLVEADVVRGRRLTSYPSLQTDIRNAGGHWTDETVVEDDNFVTSRGPQDLDAFCDAMVSRLESHRRRHAGEGGQERLIA
jgi:protease I